MSNMSKGLRAYWSKDAPIPKEQWIIVYLDNKNNICTRPFNSLGYLKGFVKSQKKQDKVIGVYKYTVEKSYRWEEI